jgi:hypothetical protein
MLEVEVFPGDSFAPPSVKRLLLQLTCPAYARRRCWRRRILNPRVIGEPMVQANSFKDDQILGNGERTAQTPSWSPAKAYVPEVERQPRIPSTNHSRTPLVQLG